MFLHLGDDVVVNLSQVIAILDLKSSQTAAATREFIEEALREKRVTEIPGGEAKSLILTQSGIYLSPISSLTLMRRADHLNRNTLPKMADTSS